MSEILTTEHERWAEFASILEGEQGCNFREREDGETIWDCSAGTDKSLTKSILIRFFPETDIDKTMDYFESNGGYCDCEILFNVNPISLAPAS